ncbi:MAG: rRNA maturation RNase YbeY [Okeania sp. SIO2H7]|nr:rRNA maturation RNase YbeY [Okeania sp. SIO2H7]
MVVQSNSQSADSELPAPDRWQTWFKIWLGQIQPDYSPIQSYELSLSLTTDDEIQALNRQYRQLDKPTNVLAFALLDGELPPIDVLASLPVELGDIIISVETAQREAQQHEHSLECELAWLASHGLLHLLGWDHPNDQRLKQMLDQQAALLRAVNFHVSDQFYYAAETY